MPGKDEFTFDDNDDFPETDLSSVFAEGEQEAPAPAPEEPAPKKKRGRGGKKPSGGSSKSRVLLLVLLLVVVGGAGVYYFMDLGGMTPATAPKTAPAKTVKQTVALPPKPASEPAQQAEVPATMVAVPAPEKVEKEQATAAALPAVEVVAAPEKAEPEQTKVAVAVPPAPQPIQAQEETPETKSAPELTTEAATSSFPEVAASPVKSPQEASIVTTPAPVKVEVKPEAKAAPVQSPAVTATGPYALDAGSYLLASNREMLVKKIRGLGYEPKITPVEATLAMTRLRLGSFPESEAQEALAFARTIEPAAFSVRDGDQYVIYAGTYLKNKSVEKLRQRFLQEGIQAEEVPVKVVRTLSRIHFGSFASKADASAVARDAKIAGFTAEVIKFQ